MPNTRGNPDWDLILEVTGSPQWLDVPHHDAFRERRSTHNQRREDREDTQEEELIKLSLKFSTPPRNGTPWFWVGRHESSDIRINSTSAVSGCHLRVGFDEWGQIVIRDPSRFGSKVTYTQLQDSKSTGIPRSQQHKSIGNKVDPPQWVVPVGWKVSMMVGQLEASFVFQAPDHSYHIENYKEMVEGLRGPQDDLMPFLGGLALDDRATTTEGILPTAERTAPGTKVGRYAWIVSDRRIGNGAFGQVFKVFNSSNWAMCAGKHMYEPLAFRHECTLMSALNHEHIVRYVDEHDSQDSESMIIMEYCEPGSLHDQHTKSRFNEEEIVTIMTQAFSAVDYLHQNNVTHRDLKPKNILIRSRDPLEIAVCDFGISTQTEYALTSTAGADYYMAPEVMGTNEDPHGTYDDQSDIWSLGVIAIELIQGELPEFAGQDDFDLGYCRRISDEAAGFLRSVQDRDFASLVNDMLSWKPVDRPTAAVCFRRVTELDRDSEDDADSESGDSEDVETGRQGEDEEDDASERSYDSESGSSDDARTIRPGDDDEWSHSSSLRRDF